MIRVIVLVTALVVPTFVFAKSPCSDDVEKYCKGMKGREQVEPCLAQHESELSQGCKAQREANRICADDVAKFCKDMKRKQREACLDEHKAELSPACKTSREAL
jgi:hypothetical protein